MKRQTAKINHLLQAAIQHHQAGKLRQAEQSYRKILKIAPNHVYATNLLGVIAKQSGKYDGAIHLFRKALRLKPDFEEAYNNLGSTYAELENLTEAAACFRRALAINPHLAVIHNNLGNVLSAQGHLEEAVACYRKALALDPNNASAYNNLGKLLKVQGDLNQAVACYLKALAINPNIVETHNNLGNVLNEQGKLTEAVACYRKALALKPDHAKAYNNLGRVLKDQGKLQAAVACLRKALAIKPDLLEARSNLLFTLNYLPDITQEEIYRASIQWNAEFKGNMPEPERDYCDTPNTGRRLRLGYVSPDFRIHSVAYFIEPVIKAHNRNIVEVFCYANVEKPDEVTDRIKLIADHWISIVGKNDREVAQQIRKDKIDILIDLTGHTGENRLLIFAYKPAPVQVSWLGYPNTTGVRAIDYRLTDAIADPVGKADNLHTEKLIRLEHGFLCFQADTAAPEPGRLPNLDLGYITFGNFNDLAKTNPDVVKLWARILHAVPSSRLLLKAKPLADQGTRARYLEMFGKEGITADRIELHGRLPKKKDHLALYNRVDIGLDPFPYNGTTTTCEALWMGVPVVTLRGERHAGRVGASIMHHIGYEELIAATADGYLSLAQSLANDRERLVALKKSLRQRMQHSRLMDRALFTTSLENAYQRMWTKLCEKAGNADSSIF